MKENITKVLIINILVLFLKDQESNYDFTIQNDEKDYIKSEINLGSKEKSFSKKVNDFKKDKKIKSKINEEFKINEGNSNNNLKTNWDFTIDENFNKKLSREKLKKNIDINNDFTLEEVKHNSKFLNDEFTINQEDYEEFIKKKDKSKNNVRNDKGLF